MIKIISKPKSRKSIIPMTEMEPLEVGRIVNKNGFDKEEEYVMRTASYDQFEVMSLTNPGHDVCWTSSRVELMVELLNPNEKITIDIFNKQV